MMGYGWAVGLFNGALGLLTYLAILAFLVLGSMYFWKGLQKKK